MTSESNETSQIIAALCHRYGWALETTERLVLAAALRGRDRVDVSAVAGELSLALEASGRRFTSADLVAGLRDQVYVSRAVHRPVQGSASWAERGLKGVAQVRAALDEITSTEGN